MINAAQFFARVKINPVCSWTFCKRHFLGVFSHFLGWVEAQKMVGELPETQRQAQNEQWCSEKYNMKRHILPRYASNQFTECLVSSVNSSLRFHCKMNELRLPPTSNAALEGKKQTYLRFLCKFKSDSSYNENEYCMETTKYVQASGYFSNVFVFKSLCFFSSRILRWRLCRSDEALLPAVLSFHELLHPLVLKT